MTSNKGQGDKKGRFDSSYKGERMDSPKNKDHKNHKFLGENKEESHYSTVKKTK